MFDRLVPAALVTAALQHLKQTNVQPGAIVAWLGHNRWDVLATLVACQRMGAVLLPLNWRLGAPELALICQHAGAGHLMGTPEMAELAQQVLTRVSLQPGRAEGIQDGDVLLVYTSGTTGQPKGAVHTAAGMQANALAAISAQGLNAATRCLAVLPLFHMGGLCIQTIPTLAAGGQVLLHPRFDADAWFDAVATWCPTTSLLVPAVMRALIDHPRWPGANLSSLKFINSGSQIVPRALIDAFHARGVPVAQVYGCTETGPVSIVLQPLEAVAHVGMAGRAALGVQVQLQPSGEVCVKGANLMRGYHRQVDTAFDTEGWFHTGDLAIQHPNGLYEVTGRCSELIISGGENIHPAEIENIASNWPGVAECVVLGLPNERWGEVPVLVLVVRPGQVVDSAALQNELATRLARFKRPRQVVVLAALPKTALGKVQRAALATQLRATLDV